MNSPKVRQFVASVTYRDAVGKEQEEEFPVRAVDYATANRVAPLIASEIVEDLRSALEQFEAILGDLPRDMPVS